MLNRFLRASLPAILAGTLGLQLAHADIYTWVDASGSINVSNLPPPEGVGVTKVTHENPAPASARVEAARAEAHDADVRALEERVGQLESELELAARQAALPLIYPPSPAPPVVQYVADLAPPAMQYALDTAPPAYSGCDSTWADCGLWWAPGIYPVGVVVVRAANFRRAHPVYGRQQFAGHPPMHGPERLHRG